MSAEDTPMQDREMINEIDESDLDLPIGVGDWLESCLSKLDNGNCLSVADRHRAAALLSYVRRQSED